MWDTLYAPLWNILYIVVVEYNISFHILTVRSQVCTIFLTINQKYLTISWNFTQILTSSIAEASDRKHPKSPKTLSTHQTPTQSAQTTTFTHFQPQINTQTTFFRRKTARVTFSQFSK
mgnify:CR=1 FL=1